MPSGNRFREIAESSRDKTNATLAEELARITTLTDEQIERLLPTRADKERLARLLEIVNSSASQNRKLARLRRSFAELGPVVLKLLRAAI